MSTPSQGVPETSLRVCLGLAKLQFCARSASFCNYPQILGRFPRETESRGPRVPDSLSFPRGCRVGSSALLTVRGRRPSAAIPRREPWVGD